MVEQDRGGPQYLSLEQAGAQAGLSSSRISQLVRAGTLPGRRYGVRLLIEREGLERWLKERAEIRQALGLD